MDPTLDVKYAVEQGKKFFPITHRKAIMGLSTNTLVLSQSLEVDVDQATNELTMNPLVVNEFNKVQQNIQQLQENITNNINVEIQNLWNRVNQIKYAGSQTVGGPADSALRWTTARKLTLTGAVTGNVNWDGSGNVSLATSVNHTHSYAGSASVAGPANTALKLNTARNIAISGAVTGNANFDGSGNISISTSVNHSHSQYSLTSHNHDTVYSKLSHTHSYLPLGGGTLSGTITGTYANFKNGYQFNGQSGKIVATQSGSPNTNTVWAW